MKKLYIALSYFTLFFLISIVLVGNLSVPTYILCAIVSIISTGLAFFLFKSPTLIRIQGITYIRYILYLLVSIYTSTFSTLAFYFKRKGKIPTDLETLPLETKSGFNRLLICQAITLTPGTVSVTSKAGSVSILKIKPQDMSGAKKFDTILRGKK